ncbi:MAG: GAF domain-containing sensor histidine kinase [Candidatus Sumerlaeaceae bacterium]|nr:GAF domain-containing sensor histidine kinase [Candidatus Sumerlaeaceae bacterium]
MADLFSALDSSLSLEAAANCVLATSVRFLNALEGILCLCDETGPSFLTLTSSVGQGFKMGVGIPVAGETPTVQQALKDGLPRVIQGPQVPELLSARVDPYQAAGSGSNLIIPMAAHGRAIGTMVLWRPQEFPAFDDNQIEAAWLVGHASALMIHDRLTTDRMVHQERLAMLGTVIAGISHSIKNILTGVRGAVGIIATGLEQDRRETIQAGHDMLNRNIQTLNNLVLNLLDISREQRSVREFFCINDLVRRSVDLLAQTCKADGVEIEVQAVREIMCFGDPDRIFTAVLNLVQNAVDAVCSVDSCDRGRRVIVSVYEATPGEITLSPSLQRRSDRWVVVSVEDTGPGIPKEEQPHIWRLFYTTKGSKGTGLGLPMTRHLIEEHGGRLYLQSDGRNRATFTILLPQKAPDPGPGHDSADHDPA